jgi:hypothetical protein
MCLCHEPDYPWDCSEPEIIDRDYIAFRECRLNPSCAEYIGEDADSNLSLLCLTFDRTSYR